MNTIKIGIVEDEVIIAKTISLYLHELGYQVVFTAGNYEEALTMVQEINIDLLLLDINLGKGKNGIALATLLNEQFGIPFIYLTANSDKATMLQAKKTLPLAFLVKPFTQDNLFSCIEIAMTNYDLYRKEQDTALKSILVKCGTIYKKIYCKDIVYLENSHVYIYLYLTDGSKETIRSAFSDIINKLPGHQFTKISRSHIVNHAHIKQIKSSFVEVAGAVELPISKEKREELLGRM